VIRKRKWREHTKNEGKRRAFDGERGGKKLLNGENHRQEEKTPEK